MPKYNLNRIQRKFKLDLKNRLRPFGHHTPPPFNLTIYKGAKAWRVPRTFVEFLLNHPVAQEFIGTFIFIEIMLDIIIYQSGPS